MTEAARSCSGIRIIDLSRVLAGPYCTSILADLGADVIRVEDPAHGDETRVWQPVVDGMSAAFAAVNHSKRSLCLDIRSARGREVLLSLLRHADVLVENFRPGTLARLGLGPAELEAANPRLIHCAIRAFAAGTAMETLPGYEATMQAHSGIMDLTGEADGPPVRCGPSVVDLSTGMAAALGILAALRQRDRTGRGLMVEPSLMRSATSLMGFQIASLSVSDAPPRRYGSGHLTLVPYGTFATTSGPVLVAASNDQLWKRLWSVLAPGESLPFIELAERVRQREAVNARVAERIATFDRDTLLSLLQDAGIPAAAVQTLSEFVADESLEPARVLASLPLSEGSRVTLPGPLVGGGLATVARRRAPRLGEHSVEILNEIGLAPDDIEALTGAKVVA
jgi:crotonobetainyl-CoA:carnitine CoA-transferase CaiB-like acyl-CoA transferase